VATGPLTITAQEDHESLASRRAQPGTKSCVLPETEKSNRVSEIQVTDHMGHVWFSSLRMSHGRLSAGRPGILGEVVVGLSVLVFSTISPVGADVATQTDWSGGAAENRTVDHWDRSFVASEGVSWLAVPGRITLTGIALDPAPKHVVDGLFVRPSSLDPVDMDGDGDLDLVGAAIAGNRVRWWRNEGGQPPVWTDMPIESGFAGASSVRAGDIDGDGSVDVVGCAWVANEVVVWYNGAQGVTWTRQSVATEFGQCHWVDLADLDDDGDLDLLGAAAAANTVAVWINDGALPIAWTMQTIDDSYGGARSLVPADLDGDGDLDLLGTALEDDDLSWWRNDGGGPISWTRHIVTDSLAGSHHADAWDMDLDGDLDIVALGYGHPWLKLYWNEGGDPVSWRGEDIGDAVVTPLVLGAGDLDGDGDMDVAATADSWNRVMWWHNNGEPPAEWPATTVASQFPSPWPLAIADLDGDGALDVVSGASGGVEVAWWRLTEFVASGFLESRVLSIPDHVVTLECTIDARIPPMTGVSVLLRVGASQDDLGDWFSIEPDRPLPVMVRGPAFLQYRVELGTSDVNVAPAVQSIAFEWTSDLQTRRGASSRVQP